MSDAYQVFVEGMADAMLDGLPGDILKSMRMAINKTVDRSRTMAARDIAEQVAFPAGYLSDANGRLSVTKRASDNDLEAIVTGRHRPTSLARFMRSGKPGPRQAGVRVQVQPGRAAFLPRAFVIRLRAGNTETLGNLGVAIRLPEGQVPLAAYKPKRIGAGLWLLFGPSVDQVFSAVAEDIAPETGVFLEDEFLRLLDL